MVLFMRVLFFGDIMGRPGRDALLTALPDLKARLAPDCIIVNGENAAAGFGITRGIAQDFFDAGVHCVTTGNHVWRQKELLPHMDRLTCLLRPLNYPEGTPGHGYTVLSLPDQRKILIVNVMGNLNMPFTLDDPFSSMDSLLQSYTLGAGINAIFVDFHAETTSEKVAMGHHLDGRVSAVIGTHTHIPTADDHILEKGTAFQTDTGMCGDFDSVIGMRKDIILRRFTRKLGNERFEPAQGEATLCGCLVTTNDSNGRATDIQAFQLGGCLKTRNIV
jgi:metallophosphoesterase (TIGR00282 family)